MELRDRMGDWFTGEMVSYFILLQLYRHTVICICGVSCHVCYVWCGVKLAQWLHWLPYMLIIALWWEHSKSYLGAIWNTQCVIVRCYHPTGLENTRTICLCRLKTGTVLCVSVLSPLVNTESREIFIDIICYFLLKARLIKPATLLELTAGVVRGCHKN